MMNIYQAISGVMADIGAVGKNDKNPNQGYKYRGIDATMNALNPALIKNKVFVVPEVLEQTREERVNTKNTTLLYSILKVRYTFYAEDGSSVSTVVIGEGMDSGDKASNKAMSAAFKYACFQTFCIPTEEMIDSESDDHDLKAKQTPKAQKPKMISPEQKAKVLAELNRTGFPVTTVTKEYNVESIDDLTEEEFKDCLEKFKKY